MTAVSDSTLGSAFNSLVSSGDRLRAAVPAPISTLAGAAAAATAVGDVASATVTLSEEALSGLGGAVDSTTSAIGRGVSDVETAAKDGLSWVANGVESAVTGAANFVVGAVELPFTIAADIGEAASSLVGDGVDLVGKTIGGVASFAEQAGAKLIDAVV